MYVQTLQSQYFFKDDSDILFLFLYMQLCYNTLMLMYNFPNIKHFSTILYLYCI